MSFAQIMKSLWATSAGNVLFLRTVSYLSLSKILPGLNAAWQQLSLTTEHGKKCRSLFGLNGIYKKKQSKNEKEKKKSWLLPLCAITLFMTIMAIMELSLGCTTPMG